MYPKALTDGLIILIYGGRDGGGGANRYLRISNVSTTMFLRQSARVPPTTYSSSIKLSHVILLVAITNYSILSSVSTTAGVGHSRSLDLNYTAI